jgi:hypothetical protein
MSPGRCGLDKPRTSVRRSYLAGYSQRVPWGASQRLQLRDGTRNSSYPTVGEAPGHAARGLSPLPP